MSTRKVTVFESQYDLGLLKSNGYNFQIAKTVLKSNGQSDWVRGYLLITSILC
jgi:hypothetical protein